ncbi:MAG: hypothetical protein HW406_888 [Candidatus Brocadiaceae bacterium]|nr:hypothetical protein [Candidatus Brocadiaceae bacterium]
MSDLQVQNSDYVINKLVDTEFRMIHVAITRRYR